MYLGNFWVASLLLAGFGNAANVRRLESSKNFVAAQPEGFRKLYAANSLPQAAAIPLSRRANTGTSICPDGKSTSLALTGVDSHLLANVKIGGQPFQLLIDTGSSDTWVATTNFVCVDRNKQERPQAACKIPTLYTKPRSAELVPGVELEQGYTNGNFVLGPMVLDTVSIGGVTVSQAQIGAVTRAFYYGDGISGGLLGLSGRATTTAVDITQKQAALYDPIFQKMVQQNLTQPFFSMSIDNAVSGPAGFLVFGGLPPVAHNDSFTTVPIIKKAKTLRATLLSPQVVDYIVPVQSFTVGGNVVKMEKLEMIVDSGTFGNIVPDELANQINGLWKPPAVFDKTELLSRIDCAATAPDVGVTLNGTTFVMKSAYAVQTRGTTCFSGWVGGGTVGGGSFVLGDVFMKSVISVFDLGTTEMHFAARV